MVTQRQRVEAASHPGAAGTIFTSNGLYGEWRDPVLIDLRDYYDADATDAENTVNIQGWIDDIEAVRGVGIAGPGLYDFDGGLVIDTQGVAIIGVGPNGSIGVADEIGTVFRSTSTTADALTIEADGVVVESIRFEGPGSGAGTARGIVVYDGVAGIPTQSRGILHRVWVRSFPGNGIVALKPERLKMSNVDSSGNGGIGILIDSIGGSTPTNPILDNCRAESNLGAHQIHVKDAHFPVLLNCQALLGTAGNANCRFQNCSGLLVIGGDFEGGGASGIQVSGTAGVIEGGVFVSVATGINCTSWTDGTIQGCRFPSSVTNNIATDSASRVHIGYNQDASTGGMNLHASSEVFLARRRQTRAYAAALTPNPYIGEVVEIAALTGNISIANPTKLARGLRLTLRFLQDGTGGRTVTFGTAFKHAWSDTGNAADTQSTITFEYNGSNWVQVGAQSPYFAA